MSSNQEVLGMVLRGRGQTVVLIKIQSTCLTHVTVVTRIRYSSQACQVDGDDIASGMC